MNSLNTLLEPTIMAWLIIFANFGLILLLQYSILRFREFMDFRFPNNIPLEMKEKLIRQEIDKHIYLYDDKKDESVPLNS